MICSSCKLEKGSLFSKDKSRPSGYRSRCKSCVKNDNVRYRQRNLQKEKQRVALYKKINKEYINAINSKRRVYKKGNCGSHTANEWLECKERYGNKCQSCGKADCKLTKDHIIPISKGGNDFIENIQPLCQSCNSRKGNRI